MKDPFDDIPKPFRRFFEDGFWGNFENMFKEIDNQNHQKHPQVNIYEADHDLLVMISLPGLKQIEDIQLNVNHSLLTVSGRLELPSDGFQIVQEEMIQGDFNREIKLPFPVRKDKVSASYKRGIIAVHLHRLFLNHTQTGIDIEDHDR